MTQELHDEYRNDLMGRKIIKLTKIPERRVVVVPRGRRYHNPNGCRAIKRAIGVQRNVTQREAEAEKLMPCRNCTHGKSKADW
jgi:hypothetical protein